MEQFDGMLSFAWQGTKKNRYTKDRWSSDANCRRLKDSEASANALLTGNRQKDKTGKWKLIACDLDNRDNWEEVISTYKALELPSTFMDRTPSNGYHIFFWVLAGIPIQSINDDRHCKHFELKGDGSNITAPGSVFDDGATYEVINDVPIAHLLPAETYRLAPYKQTSYRIYNKDDFTPSQQEVETVAFQLDPKARRNPRGWAIHCPFHNDHRSSAILFDSGWLYCSGCGAKKLMVLKQSKDTQTGYAPTHYSANPVDNSSLIDMRKWF